jgi:hypothetical protein
VFRFTYLWCLKAEKRLSIRRLWRLLEAFIQRINMTRSHNNPHNFLNCFLFPLIALQEFTKNKERWIFIIFYVFIVDKGKQLKKDSLCININSYEIFFKFCHRTKNHFPFSFHFVFNWKVSRKRLNWRFFL